jgi:hypothetical protein
MWAAALISFIPFMTGLSGTRIFYIRDLSMYFWPRFLWLRRAWASGEWPLWDPFVGAGQAAYSDPLHQMFLPPAILTRLIGSEALGFNLWISLPFPLAALGGWAFLSRRFSSAAAALGALAFTLCGPVVASSNFPNSSWCVAGLPWVMWAADRVVTTGTTRDLAWLAAAVAFQGLAGEPVTMFSTLVLVLGYAAAVGGSGTLRVPDAVRNLVLTGAGIALGVALAAIQVIPMIAAARSAERGVNISSDIWSLRPQALLETVWPHLFGDYYTVQSLNEVPWMPLMYTGREPFYFSIYFGVPLLVLAVFGMAGPGPRRWRLFWTAAGFVSVLAAFGAYTPIYPILRDHVPPFGTFRFPVKYLVVAAMAVAAGAAAGWDLLSNARTGSLDPEDQRRSQRARLVAVALAIVIAAAIAALTAVIAYAPMTISGPLQAFATRLGDETGQAGEFMIRTVPRAAAGLAVAALTAGLALLLGSGSGPRRSVASAVLYVVIVGDLLIRAWGVCPALDASHFAEPQWIRYTRADPNGRFYVGGKLEGTLITMDVDASRGYTNAPGLTGSASRAALNAQAAFYPSAWHARELLSYDLPVLWPRSYTAMMEEFQKRTGPERDRFLDRTGVRYRILPKRRGGTRTALIPIPQFYESFLFDFGPAVTPRVSIVPSAQVITPTAGQIDALFDGDWTPRTTVIVDREPQAAGTAGPAVSPSAARLIVDRSNQVTVQADVDAGGGYLLLLDSYADDWRVKVDGTAETAVRANGLFRAVRLRPGNHIVNFVYSPRPLVEGTSVSLVGVLMVLGLAVAGRPVLKRAANS